MKTAVLAIILFCVMIFPHELGHFIAARKTGVRVNEFAFGMGPVIWRKQGKETLYSIRLFPVGGFCAMEGEDEDSDDPGAFNNKRPWQKIVILAAGSFMNIVCAVIIMSIVVGVLGFTSTTVGNVTEGGPAWQAHMEKGDRIVAVNGGETSDWEEVREAIGESGGEEIAFTVERDGSFREITVTPGITQEGAYQIGIECKVSHNPFRAVIEGAKSTWNITVTMFDTLARLFTGQLGADNLSGPVGMVQMVNETSRYGLWYYGFLTALICINLAIINMLPLPALDGGRIIFVIVSMITGRPVSQRVEGAVHFAGIILLFGLMIYVTFNDVIRIFG